MGPNGRCFHPARSDPRQDGIFPTTIKAVRGLSAKWPQILAKFIEDKANGSAVIQTLAHQIVGIVTVNPEGGKVARAAAASPFDRGGQHLLAASQMARWVNDFIEEAQNW